MFKVSFKIWEILKEKLTKEIMEMKKIMKSKRTKNAVIEMDYKWLKNLKI